MAQSIGVGSTPFGFTHWEVFVYVAAGVPTGGAPLYFQLDSKNAWSAFNWPMAAFMSGVTLNSQTDQVTVQLLQNVNLSGLPGAEIIVGYGADADEMLASARFRTVFTVPSQ